MNQVTANDSDANYGKEELLQRIRHLVTQLEEDKEQKKCYDVRRNYVPCPPDEAPPPMRQPHPYIPGRYLYNYPIKIWTNQRVALDGRLGQPYLPARYYFEELPLRVPPWTKPRYPSTELRGGIFIHNCKCWKKNGLQDQCRRWDCDGSPQCLNKSCPPCLDPPIQGVRHRNGFDYLSPRKDEKIVLGPFHLPEFERMTKAHPPMAPFKGKLPEDVQPCTN